MFFLPPRRTLAGNGPDLGLRAKDRKTPAPNEGVLGSSPRQGQTLEMNEGAKGLRSAAVGHPEHRQV